MSAPRIVFAPDAGPRRGLGHLQRCLSLASALRKEGARCTFAAPAEPAVLARIADHGFPAAPLPGDGPATPALPALRAALAQERADALVVDSYLASAEDLAGLRGTVPILVAIDDDATRPLPCDLLLNGGVHAATLGYPRDDGTIRLLGPAYALLGEAYWAMPPRTHPDRARRVLLSMGGADSHGWAPRILDALAPLEDLDLTVTIGPLARNGPEVRAAAAARTPPARVAEAPASLRDLLLASDLAITAAGQTLNELAATGTPAVAVQVADNQARHLAGFVRHGTVLAVVPAQHATPEDAAREVATLARELREDRAARARMSDAGRALVDGRGALRAARAILDALDALAARRGGGP